MCNELGMVSFRSRGLYTQGPLIGGGGEAKGEGLSKADREESGRRDNSWTFSRSTSLVKTNKVGAMVQRKKRCKKEVRRTSGV